MSLNHEIKNAERHQKGINLMKVLAALDFMPYTEPHLLKQCRMDAKSLRVALRALLKDGVIVKSPLTRMYELVPEHYADRRYTKC